jgi:hypothetical protein
MLYLRIRGVLEDDDNKDKIIISEDSSKIVIFLLE